MNINHTFKLEQSTYQQQAGKWMQAELASAELGDVRLNKRFTSIVQSFSSAPDASIPQATASWNKTKAAYRFFSNKKVTHEKILQPHQNATRSRINGQKIILAVQDTTELNYTHLSETKGLGNIGTNQNLRGMLVHSTMAFTPQRVPCGLIHQQTWIRPPEEYGKTHTRRDKPIQEKESYKWLASLAATEKIQKEYPDTLVINIGDREADIYELFLQADQNISRLLVRAAQDRLIDHPEKYLWTYMEAQSLAATLEVTVPRKKKQRERITEVEIRFAPVNLMPPRNSKLTSQPILVWAIYVNEPSPSEGVEPLSWMLLTTLKVEILEDAIRYVEYYAVRFSIELFHKVLKSGCKIEKHQLKTAERLRRCLAIDSIIAWYVMFLTMMGRDVPDLPCTVLFEDIEWKALCCYAFKTKQPPATPPSLGEAVRLVAKLGGFLGRKRDGEPGVQVLWRGVKVLKTISRAWVAFGPG